MIESGVLSIEPWAVAEPTLRLDLLTETESIFALSNPRRGVLRLLACWHGRVPHQCGYRRCRSALCGRHG
jgi:hypothetical protein